MDLSVVEMDPPCEEVEVEIDVVGGVNEYSPGSLSAEHRLRLRPWLESMLDSGLVRGLQWLDSDRCYFKIPWKHRSKKDWDMEHIRVFLEWARHTGKYREGERPDYVAMKTRLRCAFNKAPDIEEVKRLHSLKSTDPYKVYRFTTKSDGGYWAMPETTKIQGKVCHVTPMVQKPDNYDSSDLSSDDDGSSVDNPLSSADEYEDAAKMAAKMADRSGATPQKHRRKRKSQPYRYPKNSILGFEHRNQSLECEVTIDGEVSVENQIIVDGEVPKDFSEEQAAETLLAFTRREDLQNANSDGVSVMSDGKYSERNHIPANNSDLIPSLLRKPTRYPRPSKRGGLSTQPPGLTRAPNKRHAAELTSEPAAKKALNLQDPAAAAAQKVFSEQSTLRQSIRQRVMDIINAKKAETPTPTGDDLSAPTVSFLQLPGRQMVPVLVQRTPLIQTAMAVSQVATDAQRAERKRGGAPAARGRNKTVKHLLGSKRAAAASGLTFSNHGNIMATGVAATTSTAGVIGEAGKVISMTTLAEETLRMREAYGAPINSVAGTTKDGGDNDKPPKLVPISLENLALYRKFREGSTGGGADGNKNIETKDDLVLDLRMTSDGKNVRRLSEEETKALDLRIVSENGIVCYKSASASLNSDSALDLTVKRKPGEDLASSAKRLQTGQLTCTTSALPGGSLAFIPIWDLSKDKKKSPDKSSPQLTTATVSADARHVVVTTKATPGVLAAVTKSPVKILPAPDTPASPAKHERSTAEWRDGDGDRKVGVMATIKQEPETDIAEDKNEDSDAKVEPEDTKPITIAPTECKHDDDDDDADDNDSTCDSVAAPLPTIVSAEREGSDELTSEMQEIQAVRHLLQLSLPDADKAIPSEEVIQKALRQTARKTKENSVSKPSPTKLAVADSVKKPATVPVPNTNILMKTDSSSSRQRLRPWLESQINNGQIKGLEWMDRDAGVFKVPWKHGGKHDWTQDDSRIFMEWARHTGRYRAGIDDEDYATWKTRLRCAFNKAPDIVEIKDQTNLSIPEPYRVYKLIPKKDLPSKNTSLQMSDDEDVFRPPRLGSYNRAPVPSVVEDLSERHTSRYPSDLRSVPSLDLVQSSPVPSLATLPPLSAPTIVQPVTPTLVMTSEVIQEDVVVEQTFPSDPNTGAPFATSNVPKLTELMNSFETRRLKTNPSNIVLTPMTVVTSPMPVVTSDAGPLLPSLPSVITNMDNILPAEALPELPEDTIVDVELVCEEPPPPSGGLTVVLKLQSREVVRETVSEGVVCQVDIHGQPEEPGRSMVTFPSRTAQQGMCDADVKICTLLPYVRRGVLLESDGGDVYATRHCRCGVHYVSDATDGECRKLKCNQPGEAHVKIFDFNDEFVPALQRYISGDSPAPSDTVHLLCGQVCRLEEIDQRILISMSVTSNRATELLQQVNQQVSQQVEAMDTDDSREAYSAAQAISGSLTQALPTISQSMS